MEENEESKELSESEASDHDLTIVLPSPKRPKKKMDVEVDKTALEMIDSDFENMLDEKAAKSNLNVANVKNLLKEVVSHEYVLDLVRQSENLGFVAESIFEPKLTRSKVKELFPSAPLRSHPLFASSKQPSEVEKLISDEFAEDSSGDEYVPMEEESEDDHESSVVSETDLRSVSPTLPPTGDSPIKWTDDGVFKVPPVKTVEETNEESLTVALRTRSKLNLEQIALETIENAFMPPDITADMYDTVTNGDTLWSDFLVMLNTEPVDEVSKKTEDDEQDPSYNILADEEISIVDTEDFRIDKAVNVSKKELRNLIAGLCEFVDNYTDESKSKVDLNAIPQVQMIEYDLQDTTLDITNEISTAESVDENEIISKDQRLLIEQQLRQHVQLLTEHFLLTYKHPEFHNMAVEIKELLYNFHHLAGANENSTFRSCNLEGSLKLICDWEAKFAEDIEEIQSMKKQVVQDLEQSKQSRLVGSEYIVKLPPLIIETIANSNVFLYPSLLPKIPFKSSSSFGKHATFINSEDELIAIGLEQFIPYLSQDPVNLVRNGQVNLKKVCLTISQFMMPTKSYTNLYHHINSCKNPRNTMNPIKYYFKNFKAPTTVHYVHTLQEYGIKAPIERDKSFLPYQFKQHLYPDTVLKSLKPAILPAPASFKSFTNRATAKKRKLTYNSSTNNKSTKSTPVSFSRRSLFCSTPKQKVVHKLDSYFKSPKLSTFETDPSCFKCYKFNSSIFKNLKVQNESMIKNTNMLPSMPSLSGLLSDSIGNASETSTSTHTSFLDATASTSQEVEDVEEVPKDNEDDINALMAASTYVKGVNRKSLSGAEKKKLRLRKEYTSNLSMLSPEDPLVLQDKAQSFAQAYFDKAHDHLNPEDYDKFMEVFANFGDSTKNVADLYKKVKTIFGKNHSDLLEEFVTFLNPSQALSVGKLTVYYKLQNMSLFLRKLELYFKEQPSQLRKIYRSLSDLANCTDVTMDRVKGTILPLLKGNSLLTDWFLQIFPTEPPPESLLKGLFEEVDVKRDGDPNQDMFELVTIPEVEDPYGGVNCICVCHKGENAKVHNQHCSSCGIKFIQGRVYVQTGKGLRLANITFNGSFDAEHYKRLNCSPDKKKRRSDNSPSKQTSFQEEVRPNVDSDEDNEFNRKKRLTKLTRRKKVKLAEKSDKTVGPTEPSTIVNIETEPLAPPKTTASMQDTGNETVAESEIVDKKLNEEGVEWDCNTSIESEVEEFCEESSQDNINTETDESEIESLSNSPIHSDNSNSNTFEQLTWTRDEDKIILETIQKEGRKEEAFVKISEVLENRTIGQIKDRFSNLMILLQKMTASTPKV